MRAASSSDSDARALSRTAYLVLLLWKIEPGCQVESLIAREIISSTWSVRRPSDDCYSRQMAVLMRGSIAS